jgi:hypothetical protein
MLSTIPADPPNTRASVAVLVVRLTLASPFGLAPCRGGLVSLVDRIERRIGTPTMLVSRRCADGEAGVVERCEAGAAVEVTTPQRVSIIPNRRVTWGGESEK